MLALSSVVFLALLVVPAFSVLGPWDQPRFENKDWDSLTVRYRLVQEHNNEIPRDFVIAGNDLAELRQLFSTKETVGVSVPWHGFLSLKLSNGQRWGIQFGTATTLGFFLRSDSYYSYHVTLENTQFHEKLREYCLKNEQKYHTPHARIENISICTNRRIVNPSKLPEIQPTFIGNFVMIGLSGEFSEVCVPLNPFQQDDTQETDAE